MSQRFCLFYAGYTAYAPSLYFDQVALYEQLTQQIGEETRLNLPAMFANLDEFKKEGESYLNSSLNIASELHIEVLSKPDSAPGYYSWRHSFIHTFEGEFPMTKIDHYYFLYGRRLSEIICNAEIISQYIHLLSNAEKHPIVLRRIDKALKDMEFGLFKMMAPAALLSGEHRHHYFSVFYKELNVGFQQFTQHDVKSFSDADFELLNNKMNEFKEFALNGFNKCYNLLKELGV